MAFTIHSASVYRVVLIYKTYIDYIQYRKACNCFRSIMVLDIDQFRPEKGGNPEKIKENQKKRFCDEGNFIFVGVAKHSSNFKFD